jgi:hypothetical protein
MKLDFHHQRKAWNWLTTHLAVELDEDFLAPSVEKLLLNCLEYIALWGVQMLQALSRWIQKSISWLQVFENWNIVQEKDARVWQKQWHPK